MGFEAKRLYKEHFEDLPRDESQESVQAADQSIQ